MRYDSLLKIREIFAALTIGKPAVMSIVVKLGYRRVCATWAPKIITVEIKIKKTEKPSVQKFYSALRKSEMSVCQE
jgi:hypothetical protein